MYYHIKIIMLWVLAIAITNPSFAQYYYGSNNKTIQLNLYSYKAVIQTEDIDESKAINLFQSINEVVKNKALRPNKGMYLIESNSEENFNSAISKLRRNVKILRIIPAFYFIDSAGEIFDYIMTDEFHVKFKSEISLSDVAELNEMYKVEILEHFEKNNEFILRVKENAILNALELSNLYHENDKSIWSTPSFICKIMKESISDPLFQYQYYLHNTGQTGGVSDCDIDALEAWDITNGSSNIIIALIDDGVESHEDLPSERIVAGYDANGDGDPSPISGDNNPHGMACAGIIAASHNLDGVRGVTSNCKIMPIQIFDGDNISDTQIAVAINWAWQHGADILSNSWGYGGEGVYHINIEQAIQDALTQGRGGLGTLVVKSAGNNGSYVTFPGTVPGVLVVGAVDKSDNKWNYSPPSSEVDIVAPSGSLGGTGDIYTIDRHGFLGYGPGDYYYNFGGTSAACPQVAGIGALLLSLDPTLRARSVGSNPNPELQNIIKYSADDYGSTNWDGYGRVNSVCE